MVEMRLGLETSQLADDDRRNVARMIGVFGIHLVMDCRTLFTVVGVQLKVGCRRRRAVLTVVV
jgi:hypothetical protein